MAQEDLRVTLEQIRDLADRALNGGDGVSKKQPKAKNARVKEERSAPQKHAGALSFSLNIRAFMKKYAKGLSGPQKLALLLARIVKGKSGQAITSEQLTTEWNRMKSVMGGRFNAAYITRAKEHGWIDSAERGSYVLSDTWKEALGAD